MTAPATHLKTTLLAVRVPSYGFIRHRYGRESWPNTGAATGKDGHLFDFAEIDALLNKSYRRTWLVLLALGGAFFTLSAMAMLN